MSTHEFDPSINIDYHGKYDNQSDIASTLIGGTVAAATDFAASVWNSLPGTEEVQTSDLLRRIDSNALNVYNENTDAVETASFIGGMLIPSGLAFKGMQAARAGTKGINWFSKAGREAQLSKVEEAFQRGAVATKEYKDARNAYYASGITNQVVDAAAMEAAIVLTMNAHPFMEDYMQDLPQNFAIGVAFGGAIGGGLGAIADRYAMKTAVGAIEKNSYTEILDNLITANKSNYNATQVQVHQANIDTLQAMVGEASSYSNYTKEIAGQMLKKYQADQTALFDGMLSPEVASVLKDNPDAKAALLKHFSSSNTGVSGVEEISYLRVPEEASTFKKVKDTLKENPIFAKIEKKDADGNVTSVKLSDVVYLPEFNRYATPKDIAHYARARDTGESIESLERRLGKTPFEKPDYNIGEELYSKSAASLDGQYAAALARVDKMDSKDLSKLVLHPDDLPLMNAVLARISKEPDTFTDLKLTVTKNAPNWGVVEQAVFKQGGVSKDHMEQLHKLTGNNAKFNLLEDAAMSSNGQRVLREWVNGDPFEKSRFRAAVDRYLRNGSRADDADYNGIKEIFDSKNRKNLLDEMRTHADKDGNVYLWRGINKGKAVGHSAVESYTTSYSVAKSFGRPQLYKVHLDDIIGSVTGKYAEREILVGSPAHQTVASLPIETASNFEFAKKATTTSNQATLSEISEMFLAKKEEAINTMLKQGVPLESIAIRTNTPVDTVKKFALSGEGTSLVEVGVFQEYTSMIKLQDAFRAENRALHLKSNINKAEAMGEKKYNWKSGIDQKMMSTLNKEFTELALQTSNSYGANLIRKNLLGEWKGALDLLRADVSNFVNTKMGTSFFTSMDHALRETGEVGSIATTVGKSVQRIANQVEEAVLKPINEHMAKVAADPVALVEANTALQLNASLSKYRVYKDRKFWQNVEVVEDGKKVLKLAPVEIQPGKIFTVQSKSVDALLTEMQTQGREMYNYKNASNKILGKKNMNDIGFWVPAVNPRNKFLAYVHDNVNQTTKLLYGNTAEELQTAIGAFKSTLTSELAKNVHIYDGSKLNIMLPSEKEMYNILHARNDALTMEIADIGMQKRGLTSAANIKANTDVFTELAGGYQHYIQAQTRNLAELAMSDSIDMLNRMSDINQLYHKNQTLTGANKLNNARNQDAAAKVRNTLLGNSNLEEYANWQAINKGFETGLSFGVNKVVEVWKALTDPVAKGFLGGKKQLTAEAVSKVDYEKFARELEKAGVHNPWKQFDQEAARMYGLANITDHKDLSTRLIYGSNAFAATVALRFGEVMQPIVNAMSLPILTGLAVANKMPPSFMGVQKQTANVGLGNVMYDGIRAMNDPKHGKLRKMWEDLGYFTPFVSEANETLKLSRSFDKNIITQAEKAIDSQLVKWLSKGADKSEEIVRSVTMHTGAMLAKRLYPELDDVGITIFARDFMDRAVGNYHAAQRPVFFQGTAGVALGLFQTYMLTMAQNMYRGIELGNFKAIGKAMLLQGGIFGAQSLPGFDLVSKTIGEHFSDNNVDLTTGLYRAVPKEVADVLMYGIPSVGTGAAMFTRGELNPRIPSPLTGGAPEIVGINFGMQAYDAASHVVSSLGNDYPDVGRALGEALSMQSISRPVARLSELATGTSINRAGKVQAGPEEVWSFTGVAARLLSTRHFEEAKMRNMDHLNSYYGSIDKDNREELMQKVRTAIRNGTLDEERLAVFAEKYFRNGGTPTGWRSAYATALGQEQAGGKANLIAKLDPESPLNFMIDNLDGEM